MAQVTEMLYTSKSVHQSVVNVDKNLYKDASTLDDLLFGNKIAVLCGDLLLGKVLTALAKLQNSEVRCLILN